MAPHTRPPPRPPLEELIALRKQKFPKMRLCDFAEQKLGITRLHMTSVEKGRRTPSTQLALRWLTALAPEARLSMFGPLPIVEERLRSFRHLAEKYPEILAAA